MSVVTSSVLSIEEADVQSTVDEPDGTVTESNADSSATLSISSLPTAEAAPAAELVAVAEEQTLVNSDEQTLPLDSASIETKPTDLVLNVSGHEQQTDEPSSSTTQVYDEGPHANPLQAAASYASTVPDSDTRDVSYSEYSATLINDDLSSFIDTHAINIDGEFLNSKGS